MKQNIIRLSYNKDIHLVNVTSEYNSNFLVTRLHLKQQYMLVNKLQLKDRNNINGIIRHDLFFLKLKLFQFSANVIVNYINAT